jgi:hypothetical protein
MIRKINFLFAIKTLIVLTLIALTYHLIIITELIPYDAVWGGRLKSREQMLQFEFVSIAINLFMLLVILIKGVYIKIKIPKLIVNSFLWLFAILFAFNTVGNLFSVSIWETIIFTPITLISAVLCLRLALT